MKPDPDDLLLEKRADIPDKRKKKRYAAFDTRGKAFPYLEIRCVTKLSHAPQFKCFIKTIPGTDFDHSFTLLYSFMAVEIRGRNLDAMRRAIQTGHCEFIQEFHDWDFLQPLPGWPVIESIEFITGEKLDDILSVHQKKPQE